MKPYDPKLREAASELADICKKHDIMAVCLFVSPTHCEFLNEIGSPTWSTLKNIEENGVPVGFRFRSKAKDFSSKEEQHRCTEATTHAVTSVFQWSKMVRDQFGKLLETLHKHMNIKYSIWGDKPDSYPGDGK